MKGNIVNTKLVDYIIYIRLSTKEGIYDLKIDTSDKSNFDYIKSKLMKFPWTHEVKTWGEVIVKLRERRQLIDLKQSYIYRKVS